MVMVSFDCGKVKLKFRFFIQGFFVKFEREIFFA